MEMKIECQQGNTLKAKFDVPYNNLSSNTYLSPECIISGAAVFKVRVDITYVSTFSPHISICKYLIFIKFFKLLQEDDLTYAIKLTSNTLEIVNKNFISDDGTWHLLYSCKVDIKDNFDVTVHMDAVLTPSVSPFAMLHEDTDLADFELRGEDGSVRVHRAVLAAASPVLGRMLSGTWREAAEGRVEVPGTSKVTLQNFKDYVYLHTLPDNGLEPLLLLASCYMMKDLEQICVSKIVSSLTAENARDLMEFAIKHNVTWLLLTILECVKYRTLKLDELREHLRVIK